MSKAINKIAVIITLLMGIAFMLSPFEVNAANDVSIRPTLTFSVKSGDVLSIETYCNEVNEYSGFLFLEYVSDVSASGDSTCNLLVDTASYKNLTQDEKSYIMTYALNHIKDSGMSDMSKNKIYNFIANLDSTTSALVRQLSNDVNADYYRAYSAIKPALRWVSGIFGFFVLVIFGGLTISMIIDISYIAIPLIQCYLTKNETKKPILVSNEAWKAVKETVDVNSSKDTMMLYFQKKSKQLVILSICLLYLIGGKIYILVGNFVDLFSGLLG